MPDPCFPNVQARLEFGGVSGSESWLATFPLGLFPPDVQCLHFKLDEAGEILK